MKIKVSAVEQKQIANEIGLTDGRTRQIVNNFKTEEINRGEHE